MTLTLIDGVPVYGTPDHLATLGVTASEAVTLCGEAKGINPQSMADGFADITARLTGALHAEDLTLAGLAECD